MYLQLTTRCNMTCSHCCFAANARGDDMTRETLLTALKLAESMDSSITLGGGEPTAHPHFFDFLGLASAYNDAAEMPVLVVTNGKRKDIALRLARMARHGLVCAELSQDDFHDPISDEVVKAFTRDERRGGYYSRDSRDSRDLRGIRTVRSIVPVGRAIDENVATEDDGCCCEDLLVDPTGRLYACGCKHVQLGTVWEPDIPSDYSSEWAHGVEAQEWLAAKAAHRMAGDASRQENELPEHEATLA